MIPDGRGDDRPAPGPVTLAVVNARVWTGNARRPWADAVVVAGDRLALVGGSAEARKLAAASPAARVVDARGALLVPGTPAGAPADEALGAYLGAHTAGGARGEMAEAGRGTLETGQRADFALLDRDLTRAAPESIRDARVLITVAGGQVVSEAPAR